MDGIHDLGGKQGFGKIPVSADKAFEHAWQKRAFAMVEALAWSVPFTADAHRFSIEKLPPVAYLSLDYFEKWAIAASALTRQAGLVDCEELATGQKSFDVNADEHVPVTADAIVEATRAGAKMQFEPQDACPAFAVGVPVRVVSWGHAGHSRVPGYLRGCSGRITQMSGFFQFADAVASGNGPAPQFCYTVSFPAREVWGREASSEDVISADFWESCLEPD